MTLPEPPNDEFGPGVWVVVAAYNEGSRLGRTLAELLSRYPNVVVVDDGSTDDTATVAMSFPCWVVRHAINRGQGASLQTGIDFALDKRATVLVTFDADGQHDPADISALLSPILKGEADVAIGSRFLGGAPGIPLSRLVVLKLAVLFTRLVSRVRVTDAHNGLRAFSRQAAMGLEIKQDRMAHASEVLDEIRRLGLRYREVPVTVRYTAATLAKGQSSWNAVRIVWQLLIGKVVK